MTNAELAVLGLIAEESRHGYQVERTIAERGMRDWAEIGFSSIYYLLRKLQGKGLIASSLDHSGDGPTRKVYHVTEAGSAELQRGILGALSQPDPCPAGLQLGLAFLPLVPSDDALGALRERTEALEVRQGALDAKRRAQASLPPNVEAMFEHSIVMIEAELGWLLSFTSRWGADL